MNLELNFQGKVVSDLKNDHKHDGTVLKQIQWSFFFQSVVSSSSSSSSFS